MKTMNRATITEVITDAIESDDKEYALVITTRILNDASELTSDLMELRDILNKYFGELMEV